MLDPLRWEDTEFYYPGHMNLLDADVLVINKVNTAPDEQIERLEEIADERNPGAQIVYASSDVDQDIDFEEELRGRKICVVEDGPTLTHGGMTFGIGCLVVSNYASKNQIVDIIPAIGYTTEQLEELEDLIMQQHLHTCVAVSMRSDNAEDKTEKINEIMDMLSKFRRVG